MTTALDLLRRHPAFWGSGESCKALSTGFEPLDALLPGGGWPLGRLTELLAAREGIGELRLLLPALVRLSCEGRWLVWVSPPHWPYAPALAAAGVDLSRVLLVRASSSQESLWAAEQALGSRACGAVLAWATAPEDRALRRLQLAAEKGAGVSLLFRPLDEGGRGSPAWLRLAVTGNEKGLEVRVLKGAAGERTVLLASPRLLSPGGGPVKALASAAGSLESLPRRGAFQGDP